ncbi:metallophosphoesterase family protein [Agaribacterium haliotis]|uniref:metallophosphoesterase family protein n=1 Tax=Agaribacterium haliotis TaxID=2013869 RepID=UPI000BB57C03|nr:metallophosphoesterase family protein [Agaribacterium haliotis]
MRIAVLSDIHSNIFALEAVLADLAGRNIDLKINLGDILYGPIAPQQTYELLMRHSFITIRGNQDRQIYEASEGELAENPTLAFIHKQLTQAAINWLKQLPANLNIDNKIFLCHGSAQSDLIYLLENIKNGSPELRQQNEIKALLSGVEQALVLCGHSHIARSVALNNEQLVVNPGSVGLPAYTDLEPVAHAMQSGSAHASYAIVDNKLGQYCVEHIKVSYDHQRAAACAAANGRDDWAVWLSSGRSQL